jgi:hypothetical protein
MVTVPRVCGPLSVFITSLNASLYNLRLILLQSLDMSNLIFTGW